MILFQLMPMTPLMMPRRGTGGRDFQQISERNRYINIASMDVSHSRPSAGRRFHAGRLYRHSGERFAAPR